MTNDLFVTQSLRKHYGAGSRAEVRALDDVSLSIPRGSFTILTGPSGSGKTTLIALLGALERPTRGQVVFDGIDLATSSDVALARMRRRLGFVFQDFCLIPNLSAGDNISYPLIPRNVARPERQRRAQELLARFGMAGKLNARAGDLSGGEQQRVAIARALAGRPEAILADEPTSNLDPDAARTLLAVFQELHKAGTTIVLAAHDAEALSLATCVVELDKGKVKSIRTGPDS
jgi:putative ABC transport system ATP-binding protein